MLELITDRSGADVDRVVYLRAKAWQDMTAEEQAEWSSELKGAYNASDLNRVEGAVKLLTAQLKEKGYPLDLVVFTDWTRESKPNTEDLARYFRNIARLRVLLPAVYESTPPAPEADLKAFTYEEANDLEKILLDIEEIMGKIADSWFYLGDLYLGEV